MKIAKTILFIITFSLRAIAQIPTSTISANSNGAITPNGYLDAVFDQYGNKYNLSDLDVNSKNVDSIGVSNKSTLLCTSGYFNLYFEPNSGMAGTSVTETNRRNVICQVFSDISAFINSPLETFGNTNRVNIWVRDINNIVAGSSTGGVLGLATAFYNVPQNTSINAGGIADNEIWKTIHSGIDSYTGVTSPISTGNDNR